MYDSESISLMNVNSFSDEPRTQRMGQPHSVSQSTQRRRLAQTRNNNAQATLVNYPNSALYRQFFSVLPIQLLSMELVSIEPDNCSHDTGVHGLHTQYVGDTGLVWAD